MDRIAQDAHQRQRYLEYYTKHGNATTTAIRFKISRKTLYKWLKVWDGTWESLKDRSKAAHTHPRTISEEEVKLIRRLAKKYKWTDLILAYQKARECYNYKRSYGSFKQTVRKIKAGKPEKKRKKRKNKPYQRAPYPGYKVQVDVKFVPISCAANGKQYYQYTAIDECSRWTYREIYEEHSTYSSERFLESLVKNAPFVIRMIQTDNGTEFTKALISNTPNDLSLFEERLQEYGIQYKRTRVATPRHNGKVERQHRLDQERFYDHLRFYNLSDLQKQLAVYQHKSNDYIKHCLGLKSPNRVIEDYLGIGL